MSTLIQLSGISDSARKPEPIALVAVTVLLLLWWWSHTLESAMLGGSSEGLAGKAVRGGAVAALLPRAVRGAPPGVFTAVLARELRYWSRDPRRRSGLISILIGGAVMPIALTLFPGQRGGSGVALPISAAFACAVGGVITANQFGFDGTAYSVHLLAGVPGYTELRARAAALSLYIAPVLLVVAMVVGLISGKGDELAALLAGAGAVIRASEPGTLLWYGLRLSHDRFAIFDVFADEAGRNAHFAGQVAAALQAKAGALVEGGWEAGVVAKVVAYEVLSATW